MISFPALFFALSSVALIAALVAIWSSLRIAFGGGAGVVIETARDLPDHAALVEEKNALLRAIKDLEYEHAVGKISDADHQRLDAAYRARAKQVLAQLDRDVKPLYEQAEKMLAEHVARASGVGPKKTKKKRRDEPIEETASPAEATPAAPPVPASAEAVLEMIRTGRIDSEAGVPELSPDLDEAERARVVAMLQQMLQKYEKAGAETKVSEGGAEAKSDEERSE